MKPAIRLQNVCKRYFLGEGRNGRYKTLRETITDTMTKSLRGLAKGASIASTNGIRRSNEIWALKDANLEIMPGDVVGVIGRNGAGKSTLLKLLSRITEPTSGRIEIRGRLGSLLEVGTGFHPELTGRENIFLNGAILGMTRAEIRRKFDDIVTFAEVEQFIDTPVKRYSSGMYVRLAFAVAAHLEPEILLVDEVLAVGDTAFQKKCLGRLDELHRHGGTVLIVSHNMGIVASLCQKAVIISHGRIDSFGEAKQQVREYVQSLSEKTKQDIREREDRTGTGVLRVSSIELVGDAGAPLETVLVGEPLTVRVGYTAKQPLGNVEISVWFSNDQGNKVTVMSNRLTGEVFSRLASEGCLECTIPKVNLTPGSYLIDVALVNNQDLADYLGGAATFDVEPGPFFPTGRTPMREHGTHLTRHTWAVKEGCNNAVVGTTLANPKPGD